MTAHNIVKNFIKHGSNLLGVGFYAAAISLKNNRVVKIGHSVSDPWLDFYYDIIKSNQNNPHIPKVYSIQEYNNYYIAIMEKLEYEYNIELADLCSDYINSYITDEELLTICEDKYKSQVPNPSFLLQALSKISNQTKNKTDITLDLHESNILFRDGVLVITDPWCELDTEMSNDFSEIIYSNDYSYE